MHGIPILQTKINYFLYVLNMFYATKPSSHIPICNKLETKLKVWKGTVVVAIPLSGSAEQKARIYAFFWLIVKIQMTIDYYVTAFWYIVILLFAPWN